jgi:hypothetical protein
MEVELQAGETVQLVDTPGEVTAACDDETILVACHVMLP